MTVRTQRILLSVGLGAVAIWTLVGIRIVDRVAPSVHAVGVPDEAPVRGTLALSFRAEDAGAGVGHVSASLGGRSIPVTRSGRGWRARVSTGAWPDGVHALRITVEDDAWPPNTSVLERPVTVDNRGPTLEIREDAFVAHQGKTWALFVRTDEALSAISAEGFGLDLPLYPVAPNLYRALLGMKIKAVPGPRVVRVEGTDLAGNRTDRRVEVRLEKTAFADGGRIRLSRAKRRMMGETAKRDAAQARRDAAYAVPIDDQLWSGQFLRPTPGVRTSSFGRFRTYNTGVSRHHHGVDIANRSGTPVVASNDGVVTLSEFQHTFGHVVILGHGQGLSTSYNHLRERLVTAGTRVRKGQQLGRLGSTGQSTGPHLHWGMEINGTSVDAEEWQDHRFEGNEPAGFR